VKPLLKLDEPDPEDAVLRYLIDLPGVFLPHSGATLFHHLLGTYRILKSWGCDEDLCVAGLFHSVYGTPAYHASALPESRRDELREVIGVPAEELVYRFSRTNWALVFSNGRDILPTLPTSLLMLAAANVIEQRERLAQTAQQSSLVAESLKCFGLLVPYLTPVAAQRLATELHLAEGGD
jgi:hypothetical protein